MDAPDVYLRNVWTIWIIQRSGDVITVAKKLSDKIKI